MKKTQLILVSQGTFELVGLLSFLIGYFAQNTPLLLFGGILVLLDDLIEIFMGILNPLFPFLLAVVLAIIFTPWYVGVFWASAAFKVLGFPGSLRKIFAAQKLVDQGVEEIQTEYYQEDETYEEDEDEDSAEVLYWKKRMTAKEDLTTPQELAAQRQKEIERAWEDSSEDE